MLAIASETRTVPTWTPKPRMEVYVNSLRVALAALELAAKMAHGEREDAVTMLVVDVKNLLHDVGEAA